ELKALASLKKTDKDILIEEIRVLVRDTAHPRASRRGRGTPGHHDNIAITDFKAGSRMAGKDMPVRFSLTLANYGRSDAKVELDIVDELTDQRYPDIDFTPAEIKLPPGGSPIGVTFDKRFPGLPEWAQQGDKIDKEGKSQSYFLYLSARIKDIRGQ